MKTSEILIKARDLISDPECNRKNAKIGRKVLADLERRFPRRGKR